MTTKNPFPQGARGMGKLVELQPGGRPDMPANAVCAEQVVIAAVIECASLAHDLDWLAQEHFFLGAHARLWGAIQRLASAAPAPLPSEPWHCDVAAELERQGHLREVGGIAGIITLVNSTPAVLDVPAQADLVLDAWRQRQIERQVSAAALAARRGDADADTLLADLEGQLLALQAHSRRPGPAVTVGAAADLALAQLAPGAPSAPLTPTGFASVDRLAGGGMAPGDLWILGGRPGLGKTALASAVATNVGFDGGGALIFSLEMRAAEIGARLLACETGLPTGATLTPGDRAELAAAVARLRTLPVEIDDDAALTIEALCARAKRAARRLAAAGTPLRLVVVDYLQILGAAPVPGKSRREEIRDISRRLKVLARELGVAVLALAQLNRAGEAEQRRPKATDIAECDQLARDADWLGILWRDKDASPLQTDLAICKQRRGRAEADVRLGWHPEITRFVDHGGAK